MPRTIYRQSAGNPIQLDLLPTAPLELEFAYHRGVDNDDVAFTWKVIRELILASFVALVCCWLQTFAANVSLGVLAVAGLVLLLGWRAVKSRFGAIRNISIVVIAAAWVYHLFPLTPAVEVYVALTATALLAREVARHFTFVATVSPTPVEKAWDVREAVCWQTLVSSLLLIPIALSVVLTQHCLILLSVSGIGWFLLASIFLQSSDAYMAGCRDAVKSWCSYNRDDEPLAGVMDSPAGNCRRRLTMLATVALLNVFALYRLTVFMQMSTGATSVGAVATSSTLLDLAFHIACLALFYGALASLPLLFVVLAICIVGTPVFGRLSIPIPSFVPADEWKDITDRVRRSRNPIEQDSFYLGRVAYDQSPMLVPSEVFQEHGHFLGDSGSGKTARGLAPFIEQVIGRGNASVMVLDLKGDSPELLQTLRAGAETSRTLTGVDVPIRYFTLRDDQATYGFNPFKLACWDRLNVLQKTDILCGALGLIYGSDYGEGYFSSANAAVLYATMTEFPNVKNFEQLRDKLAYVVASPKRHGLDDKSKDAGNHVKMSVTRLASISSLNIAEGCTPNEDVLHNCIDPSQLFKHPQAHYFSLSATLGPGSSPEIGRFATYMLLTASTLTERKVPVYLIVDEFQRMASRNLDYLLQLARSMGVAVILANQSMEDLRRYDLTSTLETNCRYRQWFAISGWDDQERLSRASGETVDTMDSMSVSQSIGDRGTTTSTSRSRNDFIAPRLTKNDIKLVSDDDRKSVVLINRGAGYAQYGGMPVVIESDFHISSDEYSQRKSAPWPSADVGTFVPSNWERPQAPVPHRGRSRDTAPPVSQETITVGPDPKPTQAKIAATKAPPPEPATATVVAVPPAEVEAGSSSTQAPKRRRSKPKRRNRKKEQPRRNDTKREIKPQSQKKPTSSKPRNPNPQPPSNQSDDLFARYLREHPIEQPIEAMAHARAR